MNFNFSQFVLWYLILFLFRYQIHPSIPMNTPAQFHGRERGVHLFIIRIGDVCVREF